MKHLIALILFFGLGKQVFCQEDQVNVLFVVDASASMLKNWGKEDKWSIAEKSLLKIADSLVRENPSLNYGLRVYGHQSLSDQNDCEDTELKLPIFKNTLAQLKDKLISVKPKGITPLSYTLIQTEKDFEGLEGQRNILILITDGSESCLGDPCEILEILLKQEVIVKPVIIGLDIDIESLKDYHCIENVFNPHSVEEFERHVLGVIQQAINYTTVQVNLFDKNHEAKQSNLALLFFSKQASPDYTFYHRLDKNGLPDTLLIAPRGEYKLVVQTIPPIIKENIKLKANVHNVINIDAPTCQLTIQSYCGNENCTIIPEIPYMIKQSGSNDYVYTSLSNSVQQYLYGNYDIDVLSLPITRFKNVALNSSKKELKLPAPGKLVVNAKFPIHAALFTEINNELVNIYTFKANSTQEILDLQPGVYQLVYRFDHKRKITETVIHSIKILSKEIVEIKI